MSKIYLLRACAYRLPEEKCNPWSYEAIVFLDLKSAVRAGKKILKKQLTEIWKTDEDREYIDNLDELLDKRESKADYIFEVEEIFPEKIQTWHGKGFAAEDGKNLCEDPLYIEWRFDYRGNLLERWFCGVDDAERFAGGGWLSHSGYAERFDPTDELPEAGTKFRLGDFVIKKRNKILNRRDDQIYIIGGCPERKGKFFENEYLCYFVDGGTFHALCHDHYHERELEKYEGEVPAAYRWLSDFVAKRIKVSEEDERRVYDGEICFSDDVSYRALQVTKK